MGMGIAGEAAGIERDVDEEKEEGRREEYVGLMASS